MPEPLNIEPHTESAPADPARPADPAAASTTGLGRRLGAIVYDALLLLALIIIFTVLVMLLRGWREIEAGTAWFQLAVVALGVLFYAGFWTHGGRTLGMLAWKLQVRRDDGRALRWRDALLRCAAAIVSLAPLGLGFWWSLVDRERLTWHDRLTRTRIVRVPPRRGVSASAAPRRS